MAAALGPGGCSQEPHETTGNGWRWARARCSDLGVLSRESQASIGPASHPLPDAISPKQDCWYPNAEEPFHPPPLSFQKLPSFLPQACLGRNRNPCWRDRGSLGGPSPHPPKPSKLDREDPGLLAVVLPVVALQGKRGRGVGVSVKESKTSLQAASLTAALFTQEECPGAE